jgi:hypothetical protein
MKLIKGDDSIYVFISFHDTKPSNHEKKSFRKKKEKKYSEKNRLLFSSRFEEDQIRWLKGNRCWIFFSWWVFELLNYLKNLERKKKLIESRGLWWLDHFTTVRVLKLMDSKPFLSIFFLHKLLASCLLFFWFLFACFYFNSLIAQ